MKKTTSTLLLIIVGFFILSCNRSIVDQSSANSETMAILKVDATTIDHKSESNFVSGSHYSTLKSIAEDEREL